MAKAGYVAIIGRPNAGKSTLLNAILGAKLSIVTPKAQTTRERVLGILTEKQGQIVFMDTPGIHQAKRGGINDYMVSEAVGALDAPDLIWYLVDPESQFKHEQIVIEILKSKRAPIFLLFSKSDLVKKTILLTHWQNLEKEITQPFIQAGVQLKWTQKISALSKQSMSLVLSQTWQYLPEGPFFYEDSDQLSNRSTRYFVAERIREQLFYCLGDEIPYSCAVQIHTFQENRRPWLIEAVIYVERESQKGMVIGRNAKKIKEIGQNARREIEHFLNASVYLGLRVKVSKDWTQRPESIAQMGYSLQKF